MNKLFQTLSSQQAVATAGFCAGFMWTIGSPANLFLAPLTTTLVGSMGGTIVSIAASFVSESMPKECVPILVFSLIGSTALYGYANYNMSYKTLVNNITKQ